MTPSRIGVAIVGCGTIGEVYAADLTGYPEVELVGVADAVPERALALAERSSTRAHGSLEELLADERVQLVVNLTPHGSHAALTAACLEAGRHVYSEKPLALDHGEARALVALAARRGVRLAASPCTLLGEAQQTAWKLVREGRLGTVRVVYAEANGGRIEASHPAPEPFHEAGALFDIGVYPLTLAVTMLGPAVRVRGFGTTVLPRRRTLDGRTFSVARPDLVVLLVELEGGAVLRLTASFYVPRKGPRRTSFELHGDDGSLVLGSWQNFDAAVELASRGGDYEPVVPVATPYPGTEYGRGVRELVQAILEERPHRLDGALAAHVVEVVCAGYAAADSGEPVEVSSRFDPPPPLPWAS